MVDFATIAVERKFFAPLANVFAAWRDQAALVRWYLPGDDGWQSEIPAFDFRPGGGKRVVFGPASGPSWQEDYRYEDIVENQRIVYTMTISVGTRPQTASLVTIEFSPIGGSTTVKVTDQLVSLRGPDGASERERGWREVLGRLAVEVD